MAFQNMGAPEEGAITVRTTVYSGEAADTSARVLEDVKLEPGGFHQYSGLLGWRVATATATSRWSGWRGPRPSTPTG